MVGALLLSDGNASADEFAVENSLERESTTERAKYEEIAKRAGW